MLVPGGMHTPFFDGRDEQYKPPRDAKLNRPEDVAQSVLFAMRQPPGCEIKELVVTSSWEGSLGRAALWGRPPRPWHRVLWAGLEGDPHAAQPDLGLLALQPAEVISAAAEVLSGRATV